MAKPKYPKGYWTEERIREAAATCTSRNEFIKNYHGAYTAAKRLGILFDITPPGNKDIYVRSGGRLRASMFEKQ